VTENKEEWLELTKVKTARLTRKRCLTGFQSGVEDKVQYSGHIKPKVVLYSLTFKQTKLNFKEMNCQCYQALQIALGTSVSPSKHNQAILPAKH